MHAPSPTTENAASAAPAPAWPSPKTAWFVLTMIGIVTVFGQMDRAIIYLLVSSIKKDLALTDTEMSLLMGLAYSAAYFLFGLPIARLTDVGKRKFILPSALALWSLGTSCCALAGSFGQFFVARMMVGAGESVKGPCAVSLISDLFPRQKLPRAFAAYNLSIRGGEALALILGGLLIGYFVKLGTVTFPVLGELKGWHMVFLLFGTPGILFAFIFMLTVREPVRHGRSRKGSVPLREVAHFLFKSPARSVLLPILLAAAVNNIEMVGVGSWRPTFYERTYGWGPADFGPILGVTSLIITPVALALGAFLSEYLAKRGYADANIRIVLCANIISLPLGIISPLMPTFYLALACSLGTLFLATMSAPSLLAAMQIVTPNELRGQVNALYMFTLSVIGSGLGPIVIALMTDHLFQAEADLRYAMVTAVAVAGPIALGLIWMALKPYGEAYRRATAST
ncbi:MAG TPA: MFS transporter [Sphingomonadaceae bacterium]|nr:MFS transporter [Sphingomonadaceae bacterium]